MTPDHPEATESPSPVASSPETSARPDRYRDWMVLAACFGLTLTMGETFWSFGVFFKPLQQTFGWSRAAVSSIFTAFLFGYAISVITTGRLVDRGNPKPVLLGSALLIVTGLCGSSLSAAPSHFRISLFMVGLGSGATWSVPNTVVQRWFHGKRGAGMALGLVTSGVGLGALIFAPLINFLIQHYGWRTTFLILAILFGAIVGLATLVLKAAPEPATGGPAPAISTGSPAVGWRIPAQPRWYASWAFAAFTFVSVVGIFTFQMLSTHLVAHATDLGISPSAAAAALGLMGGFSIPGRLLAGFLSARWGWCRLLSLAYFGTAAAMACLWWLKDIWMLYVFALSYGIFHGARVSAQVGAIPEIFGLNSLGVLIGITAAAGQMIGALAPYSAGALFDATGSYSLVFILIVPVLALAGVVASWLKPAAAGPA